MPPPRLALAALTVVALAALPRSGGAQPLVLDLPPGRTLAVALLDSTGAPLDSASVTGRWTVPRLPAGAVRLRLHGLGHLPLVSALLRADGRPLHVELLHDADATPRLTHHRAPPYRHPDIERLLDIARPGLLVSPAQIATPARRSTDLLDLVDRLPIADIAVDRRPPAGCVRLTGPMRWGAGGCLRLLVLGHSTSLRPDAVRWVALLSPLELATWRPGSPAAPSGALILVAALDPTRTATRRRPSVRPPRRRRGSADRRAVHVPAQP